MHNAFVQTQYHGDKLPRIDAIYINGTIYCDAWDGVTLSPIQASGLVAPTQGLYFWVLLSHVYFLMCPFGWCKHGTMAIGSLELKQISIDGTILRCLGRGSLEARIGLWAICTYSKIIFLGSPFPYLHFDMHIALVQTRYHGDR